jgi:hypothetical protein
MKRVNLIFVLKSIQLDIEVNASIQFEGETYTTVQMILSPKQ